MPNIQVAVNAQKVFAEYKKHYSREFKVGGRDSYIDNEFKEDLLKSITAINTKKQFCSGDYNFMLTRPQAHKIMDFYQERYTKLDDAFSKKVKIWALIIIELYGEKVDMELEKKDVLMDGNLFNNMLPILENTLRIIHGLNLNECQMAALTQALSDFGYCHKEAFEAQEAESKKAYNEIKEVSDNLRKERKADQEKIVELESKVKKFSKIFDKLKAAI